MWMIHNYFSFIPITHSYYYYFLKGKKNLFYKQENKGTNPLEERVKSKNTEKPTTQTRIYMVYILRVDNTNRATSNTTMVKSERGATSTN